MGNANSSPPPGRPGLGFECIDRILALYRSGVGERSLRSIAKEVGVAPNTVAKVLDEAGLRKRKPVKAPGAKSGAEIARGLRPSLRAVAAHAGVSLATASLALKGSPKVLPATRARVEASAQALGYRAHPYISAQLAAVRQGRTAEVQATLAYLFAQLEDVNSWEAAMDQPYGPARKFRAAQTTARKAGYQLEPFLLNQRGRSPSRLHQILESRGVRGLLVDFPAMVPIGIDFDFNRFNCVAFAEQTEFAPHVYSPNDFQDCMLLFCELWLRGYRRIGYIVADSSSVSSVFRPDAGFRHAQAHLVPDMLRIPLLPLETLSWLLRQYAATGVWAGERHRVGESEWAEALWRDPALQDDLESGFFEKAVLRNWMERHRPEVVICQNIRIHALLQDLGYEVPRDVGLAHLNLNADVADWSGIRRSDEVQGEVAVQELARAVESGRLGLPKHPLHVRIPGEWMEGRTTRQLKNPQVPITTAARRWIRRVKNQPVLDD